MATPEQLTRAFRAATITLSARTTRDMLAIWPLFQGDVDSFTRWVRAAGLVIERDRRIAAGLAATYLQAHRAASEVPPAPAVMADTAPPAQVTTALAATTFPHVRRAATLEEGLRTAFVTSSGAASRLVLNGARETITSSIRSDPGTAGWYRSTGAKPCAFCALLASRGAVYKSEETADFRVHDHCSCEPEPAYQGQSRLPKGPAAGWARLYDEHASGHEDPLNAFRRAYSAA